MVCRQQRARKQSRGETASNRPPLFSCGILFSHSQSRQALSDWLSFLLWCRFVSGTDRSSSAVKTHSGVACGAPLSASIFRSSPRKVLRKRDGEPGSVERRLRRNSHSFARRTYVGEKLSDKTTSPARHTPGWWGRMKGDGGGRENEGGVEDGVRSAETVC